MDRFIDIIETIRQKITPGSDMAWTGYDDAVKLKEELNQYIQQLRSGDRRCLKSLKTYFAPTGLFQEHSLSNGWAEEYLTLANEFDRLYKR